MLTLSTQEMDNMSTNMRIYRFWVVLSVLGLVQICEGELHHFSLHLSFFFLKERKKVADNLLARGCIHAWTDALVLLFIFFIFVFFLFVCLLRKHVFYVSPTHFHEPKIFSSP